MRRPDDTRSGGARDHPKENHAHAHPPPSRRGAYLPQVRPGALHLPAEEYLMGGYHRRRRTFLEVLGLIIWRIFR